MKILSNLQIMCFMLMSMTLIPTITSKPVPAFVSKLESILQKRAKEQEKERSLRSLEEITQENSQENKDISQVSENKDNLEQTSTRNEEDIQEDLQEGSRVNIEETSQDIQNLSTENDSKDLQDLSEVQLETRSQKGETQVLENPDQEQMNTQVREGSPENMIQHISEENEPIVSENIQNPQNMESQTKDEGTLSDLVNDLAHEAGDIAAESYPIEHEDLSTSNIQNEIPEMNIQVDPKVHTMSQNEPLPVYPLPDGFSQEKHDDIPDELIDQILRSAAQKRSEGFVLDQDNDFSSRMSDDNAFMGTQQRNPLIQSLGQGPIPTTNSTSSVMTKTSVNPVDQSVDHHEIEHQVHEDPLTGQKLHIFTGNSVNVPQESVSRKNPFDALVGGLFNLLGRGRGQASHDIHLEKPEIPVLISRNGANLNGHSTPSSVNPIIKMKNLFNFGKPNGSPETFNDYSDENLIQIMNSLKEHPSDDHEPSFEANPLDELDLEHLPSSNQNLADLSEGDEILYHNQNHDESEMTNPQGGDDIINILEPFHPSNRMKDDHNDEHAVIQYADEPQNHLEFDEDSVLHDHLAQKSHDDLIRQKAVDDLLQHLIGTTDFNTVHIQNSGHPMMGENYSTSSLGLPHVDSSQIDLSSLNSGISKKPLTDIDDLISHLENGGDATLGVNQKENSTDQYLMNVLNETGMNGDESDDLSPTDMEFYKALKDDEGDIDMNSHDHQILANHQNASMKKVKLEDKSFTSQDEEDVAHQLNNDLLQGKKSISEDSDLNSKKGNMGVIGHHKILLGEGDQGMMSKHMDKNRGKLRLTPEDLGMSQNASMDNSGIIMLKNSKRNPGKFGSLQFPPGHFKHRKHRRKHKQQHHSSYSTRVDTSELTQVLSQLAGAFGRHHHRHHHHKHRGSSSTHISTNVHINQGNHSNIQNSQIKSSEIKKSSQISHKIRNKENKIVNIENVVHHIYRQPKRKQKINIRVTVKPMNGFKSSGPCEDNCEEEINKHIEEIMNLENSNSEISSDIQHEIVPEDKLESLSHVSHNSHKIMDSGEDIVNQIQSEHISNKIEDAALDTEDLPKDLTSPQVVDNSEKELDRELVDQDSDTFYNAFNSDQRRLAQKDFRFAIRNLIHRKQ